MSDTSRKDRRRFRPNLPDVRLEDRVVLNAASMTASADSMGLGDINNRQLNASYREQFRSTQTALRDYVRQQVDLLYSPDRLGADGRPTGEALGDFSNNVAGALNAATLGLSAQTSILPGAGRRLVPALQDSLLGERPNSLARRIEWLVNSNRAVGSQRLFQTVLDRQINANLAGNSARVSNYLRLAPLNRLAVDPTTGQRTTLSRYLGTQAARQIDDTFGSLANSVGPNARASLFDSTGALDQQAATTFQRQYADALGTAAYQVNSLLSVFPNSSSLRPQIQTGLFGAGAGVGDGQATSSLYDSLTSVFPTDGGVGGQPLSPDLFNTGFQNQFTTAYQNFTTPINSFLGYQPNLGGAGGYQLPTGFFQDGATFPSLYGGSYSRTSYNSGFNNGFNTTGSGFPGFGTAPTDFNSSFGTGFNNYVGNLNQQYGFSVPTTGIGSPGLGGTIDTGTIGTGTIDTGTIGTGTTGIGGFMFF